MARTHLDRSAGRAATRGNPVLRSVWSLAWAIGPLLGAAVLAVGSYTLFHTAMLSGSVALPLYVPRTLDRPDSDVGLLFSVCAFVEVPAALGLLLLPARARKHPLILAGVLLFVGYFVMVAVSSSLAALVATQVARGVAIAVVGALGITYVQDLLPTATGRATALFANTLTTGSLISGVLAGAVAQTWGYQAALLLCGGLAAVGGVLLAASGRDDRAAAERIHADAY